MAILNALLGDEAMSQLNDREMVTLEAKVTRALLASAVHEAIASEVRADDFLSSRQKGGSAS